MHNFISRLLFGSLALAISLAAVISIPLPGYNVLFFLFIALTITASCWELEQLSIAASLQPVVGYATIASLLYICALFAELHHLCPPGTSQLILLLTLLLVFLYHFASGQRPLATISITLLPIAYLTIPLSTAISIAYFFPTDSQFDSRWWLIFLLLVSKGNDIGAYAIGKLYGRHTLTRYISPNKTWEGAIAGVAISLFSAWTYYTLTVNYQKGLEELFSPSKAILIAGALALSSQLGDLAESLLKRDAGRKDSSNIPGLGGMLDIVDGLVFSTPLLYTFMRMIFSR